MIARRLRMNDASKSSILRLVNYLTQDQGLDCRVGAIRITGCESESPPWAALEMLAVQQQNQRAKGDKTYHLVLSFHECPDADVLQKIEEYICKELGFEGHQRVSVMHGDTDNPHLHIAINKIHPKNLTIMEPYYDQRTLLDLCGKLEQQFGLQVDNHQPHAQAEENGAVNMEKAGDLESLTGWIQRTCRDDLQQAASWEVLHSILAGHGLQMHLRGNGLVIFSNSSNLHVKASSVDRCLSKNKLEKRLGTFTPAQNTAPEHAPSYELKPMAHQELDSTLLWEQYTSWSQQNILERQQALQEARHRRDAELAAASTWSDTRAVFIRHMVSGVAIKRFLHMLNRAKLLRKSQKIKDTYKHERLSIFQKHQHATWNAWLSKEAVKGNAEALAALQARAAQKERMGNSITGKERHVVAQIVPPLKVTRQGTFIYPEGVKLTANTVRLAPESGDMGIQHGLELAAHNFGKILVINGSDDFKNTVVRVAVQQKMPVRFADKTLEAQRQALLASLQPHPSQHFKQGR